MPKTQSKGDRLRMTLTDGEQEFCLGYADRELMVLMGLRGAKEWFPEGATFVTATGIYDNWTVANGQDATSWVIKPRSVVLEAALNVLRAAEREARQLQKRKAAWGEKMPALVSFLQSTKAPEVRIRHHYRWN